MDYLLHILVFIFIYAGIVQSLNLILGYTGIVSMAHAVFCAIGAYTSALISIHTGCNFLIGIAAGFLLAAILGALLAMPSLRVQDEYLLVFTLGFQMVVFEIMLTARTITQGQGGIPNIPAPSLFGIEFSEPLTYLPLAFAMTAFCFAVSWRIVCSPFGSVIKAIREDETACRALGKNSLQFKVVVFALGGGLAAIGGSTFAYYVTFISPFSFTIDVSIYLLIMVILGGQANLWGPLAGAAILVGLPELLRFLPGAGGIADTLREILYGLILMFLMLFRPQGILPERSLTFTKRENKDKSPDSFVPKHESKTQGKENTDHPILELKELVKSFGGLQAVNHVSLTLAPGKITGLIGPNGCGKTTVFNLITGCLIPDKGSIHIRGKDITQYPQYKVVREGIARSWQDVRIFKGMSVLENVMVACPSRYGENLIRLFFSPAKTSFENQNNYRSALKYLELVGLLDKQNQLAANLSVSEQKLVALARLLATGCPVLLLDEPTAALDPESVERIITLIRNIAEKEKKTILLVEHNLDVVRGLAEKVYFMSEGRILAYGEPAELMADSGLAEVYFGTD